MRFEIGQFIKTFAIMLAIYSAAGAMAYLIIMLLITQTILVITATVAGLAFLTALNEVRNDRHWGTEL